MNINDQNIISENNKSKLSLEEGKSGIVKKTQETNDIITSSENKTQNSSLLSADGTSDTNDLIADNPEADEQNEIEIKKVVKIIEVDELTDVSYDDEQEIPSNEASDNTVNNQTTFKNNTNTHANVESKEGKLNSIIASLNSNKKVKSIKLFLWSLVIIVKDFIFDFFIGIFEFLSVELKRLLNKNYLKEEFEEISLRIPHVKTNYFIKKFSVCGIIILAFEIGCAFIANNNNSTGEFLNTFLFVLFICLGFLFVSIFFNPIRTYNIIYVLLTSGLIIFGTLLQVMYQKNNDYSGVWPIIKNMIIVFFGAIIISCLINFIIKSPNKRAYTSLILFVNAPIQIFLVLKYFFGKKDNDASVATEINGTSIHLAEILKIMIIVLFVLIYTNKQLDEKKKSVYALLILGFNGLCFALSNEFGTLLVVLIAYFIITFVALKSWKNILTVFLIIIIGLGSVLGIAQSCYDQVVTYRTETSVNNDSMTDSQNTEQETIHSTDEDQTENNESDQQNPEVNAPNSLVSFLGDKYEKMLKRFGIIGDHYHENQIKNVLYTSQWLAIADENYKEVEHMDEELIFSYALMVLGIIPVILILLAYIALFCIILTRSNRIKDKTEAIMILGFSVCISIQSIFQLGVALSVFPIVGITASFLSHGGTANLVNYVMTFIILYSMRDPSVDYIKKLKKGEN